MTQTGARVTALKLVGGALCLDFANSLYWRRTDHPQELLVSYADLVDWGRQLNALTDREARYLLRQARARPAEAAAVLKRSIALREAIYKIFAAIAQERPPAISSCENLNVVLKEVMAHTQILPTKDGFAWQWVTDEGALDRILWPIARSAADLLTGKDWKRVGQCAGEGCGWLFLDQSRNRSRRWCDMADCGHRTNARLSYARRKFHRKKEERACQAPT
jgi:predicted RNA-binding Zn ribbon-like protein